MEETISLISNVAMLFLMMIPGILLKKCHLCGDSFGKGISNLVLYIAQPALIVYSYLECKSSFLDIWQNLLAVFLLSIVCHVIFAAVAIPVFSKAPDGKARMLKFATIFSNAAFMGIPLIRACMNAEAAIYASVYNITFNLFLWTLGVSLCTRVKGADLDGDGDSDTVDALISMNRQVKKEGGFLKVILHPVTIASAIGIILMVSGVNIPLYEASVESGALAQPWESVYGIIIDSLAALKNLVAPLAMVVIGLRVPEVKLHGLLSDANMYIFLVLRHLALPFAVLGIIKLLMLAGVPLSDSVAKVTVILAAAPAASSATMFAEKYDCDAVYVSRLVIVSTILSIATMPLLLMAV